MDLSCTMVLMIVLAVKTLILNEAQQRTGYGGSGPPARHPVTTCLKPLWLVYSSHFESVPLRLRMNTTRLKS